jgi:hypothetical protein
MNSMQQGGGYDYAALDSPTATLAQQAAGVIKEKIRRAAQDIVDIGAALLEVKAALPHGQFSAWLADEFGWGERQARRFMNVAEAFKTDNLSDLQIAPSALYALASPSTPAEARAEALQQARNGQPVSNKGAREAIARHKAADEGQEGDDDAPALDSQAAGAGGIQIAPDSAELDSLLTGVDIDIEGMLADTQPALDRLLADMADEEADRETDDAQRRQPPESGYMRLRVVTGSYDDAQQAKALLLDVLGSGKYTEPREASQPKYQGTYRIYSREDVQIARNAAPVEGDERGRVDELRAELRQARKEIENLQRANDDELQQANETIARLQAEVETAREKRDRTYSKLRGAIDIFEEHRLHVHKAQQYKPVSARGAAVSPLLRCIERVWILLQEK